MLSRYCSSSRRALVSRVASVANTQTSHQLPLLQQQEASSSGAGGEPWDFSRAASSTAWDPAGCWLRSRRAYSSSSQQDGDGQQADSAVDLSDPADVLAASSGGPAAEAAPGLDVPSSPSASSLLTQDPPAWLRPEALVEAATAGQETAALADALAGAWFLNAGLQHFLLAVHDATGTPWWASIALATCMARVATIPPFLMQMRNSIKMGKMRPELQQLQSWFQNELQRRPGDKKEVMAEYQTRMAQLWTKYDCHPVKSLGGIFVQAPIFIGFFSALRALSNAQVPSMQTGGALWFTDLTAADPFYLLPILTSALLLLTVEVGAMDGMQGQDASVLRRMKLFMRVLAVALVPMTASMPQGVFVYWVTSNVFSLAQAAVLRIGVLRKWLRLPPTQSTVQRGATTVEVAGKPVVTYASNPLRGSGRGVGGSGRAASSGSAAGKGRLPPDDAADEQARAQTTLGVLRKYAIGRRKRWTGSRSK